MILIKFATKNNSYANCQYKRKYLFFRRIQTEAKDYVLNTLNKIFYDLDRWIDIKK